MARLLKIKELEARRRALAQESDVYRETLGVQIQNLQLYGSHARRRFTSLGPSNPWFMLIGPLIGLLVGRRYQFPRMRLFTSVIFAWKLWRKIRVFLPRFFGRKKNRPSQEDAQASAI